jgi:hypothetical protein
MVSAVDEGSGTNMLNEEDSALDREGLIAAVVADSEE